MGAACDGAGHLGMAQVIVKGLTRPCFPATLGSVQALRLMVAFRPAKNLTGRVLGMALVDAVRGIVERRLGGGSIQNKCL